MFNDQAVEQLAKLLQERFGFSTVSQLDRAVADLIKRGAENAAKNSFSLSTMIRGMRAMKGEPINTQTAEQDIAYVRALNTGSGAGSYLVPTIQAEEIIQYLAIGGVARAGGVRIWTLDRVEKLNVPAATAVPQWQWVGQNTSQAASDPDVGQMKFDLKKRSCLVVFPNELLKFSVPAFDALLSELIGIAAAEHEDDTFFPATTVSGGPTALMQASGISTLNAAGGSANGGDLVYGDILAVLAKSVAVKARGPFVWLMSGRSYYQRVLGLTDTNGRPLAIPTGFQGLTGPEFRGAVVAPAGQLFGHPVFVTPAIPEDETVGSGTNQSHIIFMNPKYAHIAQDGNIEVAISTERYFEIDQTGVRAVHLEDFDYSPAAGIVVLKGVN